MAMISAAGDLGQQLLVVAAGPSRAPVAVSPSGDEDRREAGDEEQAGAEDAPPAGRLQLGGRDAADRREVAGHERQHAGGEEGDDARGEGGEDAHPGGGIGAQRGERSRPLRVLGAYRRRSRWPAGRRQRDCARGTLQRQRRGARLRASPLFAIGPSQPGPALRRGALVAIPVGVALLLELGLDSPTKGAIGTGALLAGFPGSTRRRGPGRPGRRRWRR